MHAFIGNPNSTVFLPRLLARHFWDHSAGALVSDLQNEAGSGIARRIGKSQVTSQMQSAMWVFRLFAVMISFSFFCFGAEPPPKELVQYIGDAQKLGLTEDVIRRNATQAGWDTKLIEEAFAALQQKPKAETSAEMPENYRIGAGDILHVSVWKEPDASADGVVVRADGKISLPLIKEVTVAGLTPTEAEKALAAKFSKYILSAEVTVIVKSVTSRKVYLVGGVRTVGALPLGARMTVLQAITQAGGVTDYAKRKKIYVLRNVEGKQVKLLFNYEAVIKGEQIEQNILLEPDDTIVVPQ